LRARSDRPGLFAVSRFDPVTNGEILIAFNTSMMPIEANLEVETRSRRFSALLGNCPAEDTAPGTVRLTLPPLGYAVCATGTSK
jgi:hypothetical protein